MFCWGYCKENGPHTWTQVAPAARGLHQSPINIQTEKVERFQLKPLVFKYPPFSSSKIFNNGHSVQITIDPQSTFLEGGPLPHKHKAAQYHFHWGRTNNLGSEHQVDGKYYAAELHVVHWNSDLYDSVEEALKGSNGLAVLGVFFKVGRHNREMEKLTSLFPKVTYKGESVPLPQGFDPSCLFPGNLDYWSYTGSLTTPPCFESARFVLFKEPVQISEEQLNAFRQLRSHQKDFQGSKDEFGGKILQNYRPPQPLHDRKVMTSK